MQYSYLSLFQRWDQSWIPEEFLTEQWLFDIGIGRASLDSIISVLQPRPKQTFPKLQSYSPGLLLTVIQSSTLFISVERILNCQYAMKNPDSQDEKGCSTKFL